MKTYLALVSVIFAAVGATHLARVIFQWPVLVNGWDVPMWVSVVGALVPLALSVYGFMQWRRL